ncbi:MAG: hypothetical protein JNL34_12750, partial [Anaerolineae bacterium]|nr:hypothetical protein [Anaerolineae bacterium]
MKRWIVAVGLLMLLAGCADETATPAQGYRLSAPTLAPSPVSNPLSALPTAAPTLIQGQNAPTYAALPSGGELPLLPAGTADSASASMPIHVTGVD